MSIRILPMLGTRERERGWSTLLSWDRHEATHALKLPELLMMLAFNFMFFLTQEG